MIVNALRQFVNEECRDIHGNRYKNEIVSYKVKDIKPCCENLIDNPLIDLYHEYPVNVHNDDPLSDGREFAVMIQHADTHPVPWEDYYETDYSYYKINVCPFCGEKIKIHIVGLMDATDEFIKLSDERNKLNEKRRNCDSKKRTAEIDKLINELDIKINSFYHSEGFNQKDRP